MSRSSDQRPLSPYMLGSYYKFQVTSLLSIISRLTGLFMAVVTVPLGILWLLSVVAGPDTYAAMTGFLGSWVGLVLVFASLFSVVYHLFNGLRHLMWDAGKGFEMSQVRSTGYLMLVTVAVVVVGVWWCAS